jgi:flagellar motor switch protein FliG
MAYRGVEKAAIFLISIGEEAASEILKNLDLQQVGKIMAAMNRIKSVKKKDQLEVLEEVKGKIKSGDLPVHTDEYVKKILKKGLGEDHAEKILDQVTKENALESLKGVDAKTLATFLVNEHPQTTALILSLLDAPQAAEVLALLPDKVRDDIARRIAETDQIPEGILRELEDILKGQLDINKGKGRKVGGVKAVAEILNHVDRSTEQGILEKIEKANPNLADNIRKYMFVFDDLMQVDDKGIQTILKEIRTEDLSLALKTASNALKEKIFRNMSQRAVQILKEEMEMRGPVKVSEVEKAQQNIVKVARKLETEGKITIGGRGGDEIVV